MCRLNYVYILDMLSNLSIYMYLQVLLFAIIFSVLIKKPGSDEEDECDEEDQSRTIEDDEEYLHEDDGEAHSSYIGYNKL